MNGIITISFFVATFIAVSGGYFNSRIRNVHQFQNTPRDVSLSCSCEDLSTLVAIVRALEEKECCSTAYVPSGGLSNPEDLIMNLVNALIQITTQALNRNDCKCHNQYGYNNNPGYEGNHHHYQNGGNSHSDGGLINLDLLNSNKRDNVLDLDVARQHLLGVGIGGSGGGSSHGYNGRNANGDNDEGLVNVDLLNPNKKSNVADVDLGKQQIVGVGLGGGGEGLVNVDLLNPKKQNNIADVDVAKQTVLGIGVGNKDDAVNDKS